MQKSKIIPSKALNKFQPKRVVVLNSQFEAQTLEGKSILRLSKYPTSIEVLTAQQDKRLKGVEKELNCLLKASKAPGFAVAVVEGDKVIYAKGFGYRDYENKIPVDANTLFAIGSTTKAFTSAILGNLRADKKLSLMTVHVNTFLS